eukprot:300219_1
MRSYLTVIVAISSIALSVDVTVDPSQISTWTISTILESVGIEYLNHEIYGNGLYAQMIFGESFEEHAGSYSPSDNTKSIASAINTHEVIRHCDFDLYATSLNNGNEDFIFQQISPGLNGATDSVSFESTNYHGYYIALDTKNGLETGRLGIIKSTNSVTYNDTATFKQVAALNSNSNQVSFTAFGQFNGYYITANGQLKGGCAGNYKSPDSDVALVQNPSNKDAASWQIISGNNGPPSENGYISCGAGRAVSTSQVDNISEMWMIDTNLGSKNSDILQSNSAYKLVNDESNAFNGAQYQRINFASILSSNGFTNIGIANYGLNCQLGLFFVGGKDYNGYIYLRNPTTNVISVTVSLQDYIKNNDILDSVVINAIVNGNKWTKYAFTFTNKQSYNSSCSNDKNGRFSCSGKFVVSLSKAGDMIDVDLTYLIPGAWGIRNYTGAGSLGLPARKELADMLEYEGMKVVRMGGSMCNRDTYRWKYFRGARENRQPYAGLWYQQQGLTQSRGFGMFEMIDTCTEIGCQALITINNQETASDMADFVEYCWGNSSSKYGAMRILDGHPGVYNVSWIEIGNEQGLTTTLLNQITSITAAMDAKSKSLGGNTPMFRYCIGHNLGGNDLSNPLTIQYINTLKPLGNRIFWDLHVGADPDSVAGWESMVTNFEALVQKENSQMRFVILEENGGDHGLLRGLGHAAYNSIFLKHGNFGIVHGYANAIEGWQGMDKEKAFPQGQLFYTPNMTFGQTTFYVNKMLDQTYLPYNIGVSSSSTNNLNVVATVSSRTAGNKNVNVFITNWGQDITVNVGTKTGSIGNNNNLDLYILQGITGANDEENSPSQPYRIYPMKQTTTTKNAFTVKANSFVIASFSIST